MPTVNGFCFVPRADLTAPGTPNAIAAKLAFAPESAVSVQASDRSVRVDVPFAVATTEGTVSLVAADDRTFRSQFSGSVAIGVRGLNVPFEREHVAPIKPRDAALMLRIVERCAARYAATDPARATEFQRQAERLRLLAQTPHQP